MADTSYQLKPSAKPKAMHYKQAVKVLAEAAGTELKAAKKQLRLRCKPIRSGHPDHWPDRTVLEEAQADLRSY
jgi:hypothetical protein